MTTQPTLDRFEAALLSSLREEVARRDRPAPRRRPGRRLAVVGGIAASVGTVIAGSFLLQPTPAFALDPQPDGDIVVTISSLEDAEGLERALREAGVEAEVDYDAELPDDLMLGDDGFGVSAGTDAAPPKGAGSGGASEAEVEVSEDTLLGDPRGPDEKRAEKQAREYAEGTLGDGPPPDAGACAMSVEWNAGGGVTFRLPATIVESDAVLHITTGGGNEDGWSWTYVQWEGDIC